MVDSALAPGAVLPNDRKLKLKVDNSNHENYKVDIISINGQKLPTAVRITNGLSTETLNLLRCKNSEMEIHLTRLKKHKVNLKKIDLTNTTATYFDNAEISSLSIASKEINLKQNNEVKLHQATDGKSTVFLDLQLETYDISSPVIDGYITPSVKTDFLSPLQVNPMQIATDKSSFMTVSDDSPELTYTDLIYKKAKVLNINKFAIVRNYMADSSVNATNSKLDKDILFTITDKNDATNTATFLVNSAKGIYVEKTDAKNIIEVRNAQLLVKEGRYTLTETNSNSNYHYGYIDVSDTNLTNPTSTPTSNTSVDIDLTNTSDTSVTKDIYNHKDYITLKITKTGDTKHSVAGTQIALYELNPNGTPKNKVDTKTVQLDSTTNSYYVQFDNISYENYGYKEEVAHDGYVLDTVMHKISRATNTSTEQLGRVISETLSNTRMKSTIKLYKKDTKRDKPIGSVHFKIVNTDPNENYKSEITTADTGIANLSNLEKGTYKIYEKIPVGYVPYSKGTEVIDTDYYFTGYSITIDANGKLYTISDDNKANGVVIANDAALSQHPIKNTPIDTPDMVIKKVDARDETKVIPNIKFSLKEIDNVNSLNEKFATTASNGIATFKDIPPGKYELREVPNSAITQYKQISSVIKITVTPERKIINTDTSVDYTTSGISVKNEVNYGNLKIIKYGETDDNRLNNIKFKVSYFSDYDSSFADGTDAPVTPVKQSNFADKEYTLTTNTVNGENGIAIQKMPIGIYKVEEVSTPLGYKTATSYYVKVSEGTQTNPVLVKIKNEIENVQLVINKTDVDTKESIKDAKFKIERKHDNDDEYTAIKNGSADVFTTDENGTINVSVQKSKYHITEVTPADKYRLESVKFDKISQENQTASLEIAKDTTVNVTNEKIKTKLLVKAYATDKKYPSVETDLKNVKVILQKYNEKANAWEEVTTSTTDDSGNKIKGVVFELFAKDDKDAKNVIMSSTTDENGITTMNGVAFGQYYLKEKSTLDNLLISDEKLDVVIDYDNKNVEKM